MTNIATDPQWAEYRKDLQRAYRSKNLTLFLGAGVSVGSNLPTWNELVYMLYAFALNKDKKDKWEGGKPFSNYLQAIAEFLKKQEAEPLEITARKIRDIYDQLDEPEQFGLDLRAMLYSGYYDVYDSQGGFNAEELLRGNSTLNGVLELCKIPSKGAAAVVSYNYDCLLESVLQFNNRKCKPIFDNSKPKRGQLPIYHPHGYLPPESTVDGSDPEEIIFTEEQYHRVSMDPYHWSNLVQISSMTGKTGLMIGLSLSDRNIRRLLHALSQSPLPVKIYALLPEPHLKEPNNEECEEIHQNAIKINRTKRKSSRMRKSSAYGIKGPIFAEEIRSIISELKNQTLSQQESVLKSMGIYPIWFKNFTEIQRFCHTIKT